MSILKEQAVNGHHILPTDEASPIGPFIFSYFSLFSNVFFLSAAGVLPFESALKNAFSENLC